MKVGVLFSGGKDSVYALYKAMEKHKPVCLITMFSKNPESYMFHTANIDLTLLQSKAIGLPLVIGRTKGEKEKELVDLRRVIKQAIETYKIQGIFTGAIESVYQSERVQKICDELDLKCFNPIWKRDQINLLTELVKKKFKVIISGIFAYPLSEKLLGKTIDSKVILSLNKLYHTKYEISPAGEGGEIETTVLNAPFFKKEIKITESEIKSKENEGLFIIKKAELK